MAGVMLQVLPNFLSKVIKNQSFYICKHTWKFIDSENYCITHHDDKMFFLPFGRYHTLPTRDINKLLQKMDAFCFTYQHVDCL